MHQGGMPWAGLNLDPQPARACPSADSAPSGLHAQRKHPDGLVPSAEKEASLPAQVSYSIPPVSGKEFQYLLFATA